MQRFGAFRQVVNLFQLRFPHAQTSAHAGDVVVVSEVVSVVAVTGTETAVFFFFALVELPRLQSLLASHALFLRQIVLSPSTLILGLVLLLQSSLCRDHLAD